MFGNKKASVAGIAAAHGLTYAESVPAAGQDLRGINLGKTRKDVAETTGEPRIQFGNSGLKYGLGGSDFRPSRRGYVAVRHGRPLPRMYVEATSLGAKTPLNVASNVLNVLAAFDNADGAPLTSPIQEFKPKAESLALPPGTPFGVFCLKERVAEGRALISPAALELLTVLAESCDVEVRDDWVIAYSNYGDVVTDDVPVWEWAFSVASRLVDLSRLWGAGAAFGSTWELYTPQRIERPRGLDGSLGFLKRSK